MTDKLTGDTSRTATLQQAPQPGRNSALLDLQPLHARISGILETAQAQPPKPKIPPAVNSRQVIGLPPELDRFVEIQSSSDTETLIGDGTPAIEQPIGVVRPKIEACITPLPARPKLRLVPTLKTAAPTPINTAVRAFLEAPDTPDDDISVPCPEISEDFIVNDQGVTWLKTNKNGETTETWLSSRIDVEALARSTDSKSWGTLISFLDLDGVRHRWCIPNKMFASGMSTIVSTLQDQGAQIAQPAIRRQELMRYIQECRNSPTSTIIAPVLAGRHHLI